MQVLKKHYTTRSFGPVTGFNGGVSLFYGPPIMTAWCFHVGDVLIDCCTRHLREPLLADLQKRPLSVLLVTHHHEDHSANAAAIKERFNVRIFGHPHTAAQLRHSFKIKPYQHLAWGKCDPVTLEILPSVIESGPYTFEPVHTPGHSLDHTVFLEKNNGWLFSGDLFLGTKIKFFRSDEVLEDQLSSLKKVLTLDFQDLFCGHRPTLGSGKELIREKLDFLENFYGSVKELYLQGFTRKEITRHLDPVNERGVKWITLNDACFSHMARSAFRLAQKETEEIRP